MTPRYHLRHGWKGSWRDGIYEYTHYHSQTHEVLVVARGTARVRFGGAKGRVISLKSGDVAILPAGVGHEHIEARTDLLVVDAYPKPNRYDVVPRLGSRKEHAGSSQRVAFFSPITSVVLSPRSSRPLAATMPRRLDIFTDLSLINSDCGLIGVADHLLLSSCLIGAARRLLSGVIPALQFNNGDYLRRTMTAPVHIRHSVVRFSRAARQIYPHEQTFATTITYELGRVLIKSRVVKIGWCPSDRFKTENGPTASLFRGNVRLQLSIRQTNSMKSCT